jgi:hypothetical protein
MLLRQSVKVTSFKKKKMIDLLIQVPTLSFSLLSRKSLSNVIEAIQARYFHPRLLHFKSNKKQTIFCD